MAISLLKKLTGPWETVRDYLLQDLQKIQTAINGLPDVPTFIEPRSASVLSSPTPSIDTDSVDFFSITRLTQPILSFTMNLQGSPVEGQELTIRILDDGTPRAITWGAKFSSSIGTLPTSTVANQYLYIQLVYNSITSTWNCLSSSVVSPSIPNLTPVRGGLIYANSTPAWAEKAVGTGLLHADGTDVVGWSNVVNADVDNAAAIAWTKISKVGSSLADLITRSAADLTSGLLALARGGTNADLSATGGAGKFLKQASSGAAITVVQPATTDISDITSGTFTPADGSGAGLVLTVSYATYIKVGKLVFIDMRIVWPATGDGTNVLISGLPFTAGTNTYYTVVGVVQGTSHCSNMLVQASSTTALVYDQTASAVYTNTGLSGLTLNFNGVYATA